MSFHNKGLWMSKDGVCLADGEICYDSVSKVEPKRSHQWFMDGETALFPSKKQAVEISHSDSFGGIPASNLSPWESVPGFNSIPSQLPEQLFDADADAARDTNFDEGNVPTVNVGSLQMGRKVIEDPFESNASFGLSMSHSLEDPKSQINYGGIRKVKVSEVRDPDSFIPISAGPLYLKEANEGITAAHVYGKVDDTGISMGLTYGQEEENVVPLADSYGLVNDNYVSVGQSYTTDACNTLAVGNPYKADGSTTQMANSFSGADCNIMPISGNFSKGNDNGVISLSHMYKGDKSITMTHCYNEGDTLTTAITPSNRKCEKYALPVGHSFDKEAGNIISFGSCNDDDADAPGRLMYNYDLLIGQPSVERCNTLNQKDLTVSNGNNVTIVSTQVIASGLESTSRKKEDTKSTKKTPPNNFPSNVRSLLSTGILDEVPVKYIAWSREKELRGIIKGSGYLCGCQPCNFSKVINAYEFERHAGCKTKHPNNHIYFENGKTIYGIVQELRNTPQNLLFDVIQTITGSPINQKSFRLWKESFLAATRELQRIYGKDERNKPL